MLPLRKLTLATFAATLVAAPATVAVAQDAPTQPETSQQPAETQASEFDDAQVDAFADAVVQLDKIKDKHAEDLQNAKDEAEQQKVLKQLDAEMRDVIEKKDNLTVDNYLAINRAASNDEKLGQKIAQRIQELQDEEAG